MSSSTIPSRSPALRVAIIGGGITGLHLAVGLADRSIACTVYERTAAFRYIGAGIGLSANAERAMTMLAPEIHAAYKRVANKNGEDYFQWNDGFGSGELMFKLYVGEEGFQGCRRSDFMEELAKLLPEEWVRVRLGMELDELSQRPDGSVSLVFKDGSTDEADFVIGCDGIRSRVRQLILAGPAASAGYSQKFCFRALIPMAEARDALGAFKSSTRIMYNGPGAHAITYPVSNSAFLNALLVISDADPWPASNAAGGSVRHTAEGTRAEAVEAFHDWHPTLQALSRLFPERMEKWAVFDMLQHPAPSYVAGSVCVAGDAAHAVGPHLGAGAGFGIEDALVLVEVIKAAQEEAARGSDLDGRGEKMGKAELVNAALMAYNDVRYHRTQWLVKHTRDAVDLFQWTDERGKDPDQFGREITWRFYEIWSHDTEGMVKEALDDFARRIS